jgi:hypothetical protein
VFGAAVRYPVLVGHADCRRSQRPDKYGTNRFLQPVVRKALAGHLLQTLSPKPRLSGSVFRATKDRTPGKRRRGVDYSPGRQKLFHPPKPSSPNPNYNPEVVPTAPKIFSPAPETRPLPVLCKHVQRYQTSETAVLQALLPLFDVGCGF